MASKAFCNQEDACALQERLDDEPEPVIAQSETLVLKHPRVAALHRPAPLAQSRAGRLTSQVDPRRDTEEAAQIAMVLSVVPFVGEHGADPGHNREGGQEQALEDERIVNIGGGGHARNRHAASIYCDVVFGPPLGTVGRIGPGEIPCAFGAHRATVQDQVGVAPQHANQQGVHLGQHTRLGPACQPSPQGRTAGLRRCRGQAAPGRALAQEAPQGPQHPHRLGRRVTASPVVLLIDQTKVSERHQVVMVAVRLGGRALPLAWRVKETQGAIGFAEQRAALEAAARLLPAGTKPVLMGDRFYGSPDLIAWCRGQGWDWRLRLKQDLLVFEDGRAEKNPATPDPEATPDPSPPCSSAGSGASTPAFI